MKLLPAPKHTPKRLILTPVISVAVLLFTAAVILLNLHLSRLPTVLGSQTEKREPGIDQSQYLFWKTAAENNPQYRDAYIQLAIHAYTLGKNGEAYEALLKASELDPNSETILSLEKIIAKPTP